MGCIRLLSIRRLCLDGARLGLTFCQGLPGLLADAASFVVCGTADPDFCDCIIRLRSFCETFVVPRVYELGVAARPGRSAANPCESEDVRPADV
ncbi:hypothetical protein KC340_g157 [Hortaea werneckii]|nr:hypothetical protein KC340_g157 [Hortaea werneckii]